MLIPKKAKKPKKKRKASPKTILKRKAWSVFSLWIRHRDADKNGYCKCVTCNEVKPIKEMQAGHAIGGRNNYLLFDEEIVYAQCYTCNVINHGEYGKYASFLIAKHGVDWYNEKDKYKAVQLSMRDYQNVIDKYQLKDK